MAPIFYCPVASDRLAECFSVEFDLAGVERNLLGCLPEAGSGVLVPSQARDPGGLDDQVVPLGIEFVLDAACCMEKEEAKVAPSPAVSQATRTEFGRPRSSIRLSTWAAMATSVARAWSLWKRSPSPMTCFQRANWPSTPAL
jgi:hypothetical protein